MMSHKTNQEVPFAILSAKTERSHGRWCHKIEGKTILTPIPILGKAWLAEDVSF